MERNVYSPPTAPVADLTNPVVAMGRPRQVSVAARLLAASLALGVITSTIVQPHTAMNSRAALVQISSEILTFSIIAWLAYKIWIGRNWARITFAVLTGVGWAFYVPALIRIFQLSPVAGSINILQTLLQLAALYLLFSNPGRAWFGGKATGTVRTGEAI
jgi:hypothetical protein